MRLRLLLPAAVALAAIVIMIPRPAVAQDGPGARDATSRLSFDEWLAGFRADALADGLDPTLVDNALTGLEPLARVVNEDRTQAEIVLPFDAYLKRTLTPATIRQAREARAAHAELLQRIADSYGVPPGVIVAIWGLESRFGRNPGRTPAVQALATLAWDGRRATFFRGELLNALRLVDRGNIDLPRLTGSWAGAMGQPQFMPSSYLAYAEDYDGDGRRDIWVSMPDVFASIANYLAKNGWQAAMDWGREVAVTKVQLKRVRREVPRRSGGCYAVRDTTEARPVAVWRRLGVRRRNGQPLPASDTPLSLVSSGARSFLVTASYFAVLRYNCAHAYALSAVLLADEAGKAAPAEPARTRPAPRPR